MLVSELWSQLNIECRNFGAPKESEALTFINQAISQMNDFLIGINDKNMVKTLAVVSGQNVPEDWSGKYAGQFPVIDEDGKFTITHPFGNTVTIKYFARKPLVTSMSDTVQFDDNTAVILPQMAAVRAINRAEGDTTNDERLLNERLDELKAARGS